MTTATLIQADTLVAPVVPARVRRTMPRHILWLTAVCLLQVGLAVRPGAVMTPFEDEGLYIYIGHRMIDHILHGAFLSEYPGAYFSGAPGFYPVLAAVGDFVGGLQGARCVSLLFAVGATICVYGLGRELYGRRAGLLAAVIFVLCGSVIYQSDFATYDSTTLCLVAAAAWMSVRSVIRNRFMWAPVVAVLLVLAFYAKYAGAVYAPIVALLGLSVARPGQRLVVARRTLFMAVAALVLAYFIFVLWGQSLRNGIAVTTTSRAIINPASPAFLIQQIIGWAGPWLALALLGTLATRRTWITSIVLMLGSVVGPLEQVRIGEATSLAKHVAFGMIFAAPLAGMLLACLTDRTRWLTAPMAAAVLFSLGASGLHNSQEFMTGWPSDKALLAPLEQLVAATPGKTILGEQPAAERYALRTRTRPLQWTDTYAFPYDNKTGPAAYKEAIDQTAFGVILLAKQPYPEQPGGSPTRNGAYIFQYLKTVKTPYKLVGTVNRLVRGAVVGKWYLFVPKVVNIPKHVPGLTMAEQRHMVHNRKHRSSKRQAAGLHRTTSPIARTPVGGARSAHKRLQHGGEYTVPGFGTVTWTSGR